MTNSEQLHENLADVKEPAKVEAGLEVTNGPELERIVDQVGELAEAIQGDKPINIASVLELENALSQIKIDVGGELMTLEEIKRIPGFKEQMIIISEVLAGNASNCFKLTFLTKQAVESLSHYQGDLYLRGLSSLSDTAAESLSHHQGALSLSGLSFLSDTAAESLSHHQGELYLNGLSSLSDSAVESLSRHQGYLSFSDNIEKRVEKFKTKK